MGTNALVYQLEDYQDLRHVENARTILMAGKPMVLEGSHASTARGVKGGGVIHTLMPPWT